MPWGPNHKSKPKILGTRVFEKTFNRFQEIAKEEGKPRTSDLLNEVITNFIDKYDRKQKRLQKKQG